MATLHCNNFVGNAWKKDLCLNCFKSKEEHAITNGHFNSVVPTKILDPPKEGILKGTKLGNQTTKRSKVIFLNTECEIIGFGGDDVYSDEEEDYLNSLCNGETEDADIEDSEEDKAFQKLTKSNTDFNSIPENLQEPKEGEVKKIIEPLKLGKQVFDDKGNKKTLLISVTPFGDQTSVKNKINVNLNKTNNIVAEDIKVKPVSNSEKQKKDLTMLGKIKLEEEKIRSIANGDSVKENVNFLNSEITQKEKSENSVETRGDDSSYKAVNDKSLKRSQPLDKNFKIRVNKDLQKENEKNIEMNGKEDNKIKTSDKVNILIDKAKKKVNQFPVITDNSNFKFKAKDFINESVKKVSENNKTVVLDMFNIREKDDVKIHNEKNLEKVNKKILVLPEIRNHILSSDVKISKSNVEENKEKKEKTKNDFRADQEIKNTNDTSKSCSNESDAPQKNLVIDKNKLIPNVSTLYRHHFMNVLSKSDEEEKTEIEVVSPSLKPTVKKVIGSMSLVPNIEYNFTEASRTVECTTSESKENSSESKSEVTTTELENLEANVEEDKITGDDKFKSSFNSFENFKNIKDKEITLFSAENEIGHANYDKKKQTNREKNAIPEISRESAGEPDGRADSDDLSEPPALPLKPPPLVAEFRTTFLQDLPMVEEGVKMGVSDKPKVPVKPLKIQSKKTNFQSPLHMNRPKSPSMEKFLDSTSSSQFRSHPTLQESLSSDSSTNQKRPAPKPPSPKDDASKKFVAVLSDEKPFELNLDQSETENADILRISKSTENLLEIITSQNEKDKLETEGLEEIIVPEPLPRKNLSRSQDSLVVEPEEVQTKKKPSRGRFFLRKLLHLGKSKEASSKDLNSSCPRSSLPPAPKPKLEIIHPNDLNGTRVEVVPPARTSKSRRTSSSASSSSGEQRESDVLSDSSTSHSLSSSGNDSQSTIDRNKKPPPPPRAHLVESWNAKPARPPPPKSIDNLRQANVSWCTTVETKPDNLYVNLGEARIGLAPHKPMRTGSLREVSMDTSKRLVNVSTQPEDSDYESFIVSPPQGLSSSPQLEDNLYECVQASNYRSSLPECDSSMTDCNNSEYVKGKRSSTCRNNSYRRSESNVDLNSDSFKIKFLRSVSLPYCASETESEIYSPYSFYGSELAEDDYDSSSATHSLRMSRLKLKKGRSIVHKNLEDNYGAVIVANHEALAQVVEQMRQGPSTPPVLRSLSTAANLRWTDFTIAKDEPGVVVERRVFYPALWGTHNVTLSVMAEQSLNSSLHAKGPFNLNPITELNDLVPASYLPMLKQNDSELIQASISILTRLQIETIETYGKNKNNGILNEELKKEINFVLLQIINAFKSLQAQGIEEAPKNLTNLVVCREEKDPHPRICIIHSIERSKSETSLCQCLIHAIKDILPRTDLTPLISNVLLKEKAVSLSQAKAILEFSLWGPSDIAFGNSNRERESALQRWLDLERATVLHGLVRTRAELTVFEEWQLFFLVRTSSKILAEASLALENSNMENVSTA